MLNKVGTQTIETERLILRRMTIADAPDMYKYWASDPFVPRFFTWNAHSSVEETAGLIKNWVEGYDDLLCFHWIIYCKECDHTIGTAYIDTIDEENQSGVISCILSREWWGKGIAAEVTKAVVNYAFEEVGFVKIFAHHHEENAASGKALLKAGFSYVDKCYHSYENESINGNYLRYVIENLN